VQTVEIPLHVLARGGLPQVCPISGATEGVTYRPIELTVHPAWVWLFAPFGIVITLTLAAVLGRRAEGRLAFQKEAHLRWRRSEAALSLSVAIAVAAGVASIYLWAYEQPAAALMLVLLAVGAPLGVWLGLLRGRRVLVRRITDTAVLVTIPNAAAAEAYRATLAGSDWGLPTAAAVTLERGVRPSGPAPEGTRCARHADTLAHWTCGRCGSFFCPRCARHSSPNTPPLCVGCFEVLAASAPVLRAAAAELGRLTYLGLGLGVLALLPDCGVAKLASLLVNACAIAANLSVARDRRSPAWWLPLVGLGLTAVGVALIVILGPATS
jgi:hypothetical protein